MSATWRGRGPLDAEVFASDMGPILVRGAPRRQPGGNARSEQAADTPGGPGRVRAGACAGQWGATAAGVRVAVTTRVPSSTW
ncbi:hypothetical protein TPA0909_23140 [Streptomyces albus]|nr:hypothetical protein TPA0909_23140 [Streptomyces albus]